MEEDNEQLTKVACRQCKTFRYLNEADYIFLVQEENWQCIVCGSERTPKVLSEEYGTTE